MQLLTLHHYGFLTHNTIAWLAENELLFGKPLKVFETVTIHSQKVNVSFIQQSERNTLTELIEPWEDNVKLQRMITKGITVYHTGYLAAPGSFDTILLSFKEKEIHALQPFYSEAFGNKRCVFLMTQNIGMIEIIEQ